MGNIRGGFSVADNCCSGHWKLSGPRKLHSRGERKPGAETEGMKDVGRSRLWLSVPLPGTQAMCMEEVGAPVRKEQRDKNMRHVHCQPGGLHLVGTQEGFE